MYNSIQMSWKEYFADLATKSKSANSHPAKLILLQQLLGKISGLEDEEMIQELLPNIEKKLGSKILGLRGKADLIFGPIVFEIKVSLKKEKEDAQIQLKKYFNILNEYEPDRTHLGIVTDVTNFIAFKPRFENGLVTDVIELSSINLNKDTPENCVLWLDAFLFSKDGLKPTPEDLNLRFGPGSPTYETYVDRLESLWSRLEEEEEAQLKFRLWTKHMQIVYGSTPPVQSFLEHTYLDTLVKLFVFFKLADLQTTSQTDIGEVLDGQYFRNYGIENLFEEDFFVWILQPTVRKEILEITDVLAKEIRKYDIAQIDEDLFKEIYQQIVKKSERHRVGEYYTPEWLAQITLEQALNAWQSRHGASIPRVLDPACGSGTFITNTIRWMREKLAAADSNEQLEYILTAVVGADINPLAVTISRSNYIIALGELIRNKNRAISIPIYFCDSIMLPTVSRNVTGNVTIYDYQAESDHLQIPSRILVSPYLKSLVLSAFSSALYHYEKFGLVDKATDLFHKHTSEVITDDESTVLTATLETLLKLEHDKKDAIWLFILNNVYAPIALSTSQFDILVGNPPWIAMRSIANPRYQEFLKAQVFKYDLLDSSEVQLYTHMEIATLFFCLTAERYLKRSGIIAFLMPISVLAASQQHKNFQLFKKPRLKLLKVLNFEHVSEIFSLPPRILIAEKGEKTVYPVQEIDFYGNIGAFRRNQSLL